MAATRTRVSTPKPEDLKGVRSFIYRIDLDDPSAKPIMEFKGRWSRHAADMMQKHCMRGLRQHKRTLLQEALNDRGSEEPRDEAA